MSAASSLPLSMEQESLHATFDFSKEEAPDLVPMPDTITGVQARGREELNVTTDQPLGPGRHLFDESFTLEAVDSTNNTHGIVCFCSRFRPSDSLPPLPPPPLALSHTCSCRAQYLPHPPLPTPTHVCACMMCNQTIISKGFNGGPTASSRKAATDPEWELVKVFHYTEQEVDDTFGYDRWQVYCAPTPSFSNGYMPCLGASTQVSCLYICRTCLNK